MLNTKNEYLDPKKHSELKINNNDFSDVSFAVNTANVVPAELNQLILEYPIFITQSPTSKQYQLSVLLGIQAGKNLFIRAGKWDAKFVPLDILRRPFALVLKDEDFNEDALIAIDVASSMVSKKVGQAIFKQDTSATDFLKRIQAMFSELMKGTQQVRKMMAVATKYKLIESLSIEYKQNLELKIFDGVSGFSKDKIEKLPAAALKECFDVGLIAAFYQLETSKQNVEKLLKRIESQ